MYLRNKMRDGQYSSFLQQTFIECLGVPWWLSGLGIWHCHCCGSGGTGLIPGPEVSACCGLSQKKKVGRGHLLSVCCVPIVIPGARDTVVDKKSVFLRLRFLWEDR